ncbi:MAG: hypothetical protein V9F00_10590 [Nocardioides sp.]
MTEEPLEVVPSFLTKTEYVALADCKTSEPTSSSTKTTKDDVGNNGNGGPGKGHLPNAGWDPLLPAGLGALFLLGGAGLLIYTRPRRAVD